ncbi:hypothetical protein H8356DRAFT_1317890 [Neocallimastix lanati (nom. inval.)]|nr:hypothetical protein H8356DRAFT_1317890 [Neocallimastix sp. JGI-2020a]
MIGNNVQVVNPNVISSSNKLVVLDSTSIFQNSLNYEFFSSFKFGVSKFILKDDTGKELYIWSYQNFKRKGFLKDSEGKEIFSFTIKSVLLGRDFIINKSDSDEQITISLRTSPSFVNMKYEIEFFNKSTSKNEILYVNCKPGYRACTIYYGKKKEGGQLICNFERTHFIPKSVYKIEIVPGVDTIFINTIIYFIQLIQVRLTAKVASKGVNV